MKTIALQSASRVFAVFFCRATVLSKKSFKLLMAYLPILMGFPAQSADVIIATPSGGLRVQTRSWIEKRDDHVVKQEWDYSCGAASLATILNEFYGLPVSEEQILEMMGTAQMRASFSDMARALTKFGFRAVALAASYEQLSKLKIPAIVYLKHRKTDHFSVIRGIDSRSVWLADSSLGNRYYSKSQFMDMWRTRSDSTLNGRLLVVLPVDRATANPSNTFFSNSVQRRTDFAERLSATGRLESP